MPDSISGADVAHWWAIAGAALGVCVVELFREMSAPCPTLSLEKVWVIPSGTGHNFVDAKHLHPKHLRNNCPPDATFGEISYLYHLIPFQLGVHRFFTKYASAFYGHISTIVRRSSNPKMVWVYAKSIIPTWTVVAYKKTLWNWSPVNNPAYDVSAYLPLERKPPFDLSVTNIQACSDPNMATTIVREVKDFAYKSVVNIVGQSLRYKVFGGKIWRHIKSNVFAVLAPSWRQPLGALELSHTNIWGSIK